MRLKCIPEDFRVRELLDFEPAADGEHYIHLLHKEKLSTPEALSTLVQRGDVPRDAIAYAGLKDRQAVTEQFVSIAGRQVDLRLPNLRVSCVGRSRTAITSRMSRGNAFTIVARDLRPAQAAHLRRQLPSLQKTGFPNYFDDQRFGCLRHGQGFVMRDVLRGDYERAVQALVAEPSPAAISGDVRLKRALRARWGDWQACLEVARGPIYQPVFHHLLSHPDDFRGALELLPTRMRVIHSFAYQSFLWNRALSYMVWPAIASAQRLRVTTLAGPVVAWKYLDPEREAKLLVMNTPLYGPEGSGGAEPFRKAMVEQFDRLGLQRGDFLREPVPGMIWKEEPRAAMVKPANLADIELAPDEMHDGNMKATLSFELPRGAYATMMLKRLFAPNWYHGREGEGDGERRPGYGQGDREGPRDHRGHRDDRGDRSDRDDRGDRDRGPWRPREDRAPRGPNPRADRGDRTDLPRRKEEPRDLPQEQVDDEDEV